MRRLFLLAFSFAVLAGCQPNQVGAPCQLADPANCGIEAPPDNANTLCEPDSQCDQTFICLGQGQGLNTGIVDQYCTANCEVNDDCPDGFVCDVVAEVGPNANRKVCLRPLE